MNLEYIDIEGEIQRIFIKIKLNDEDPKLDDEGNKLPFLSELEDKIVEGLKNGEAVCREDAL